jgi:hypothetical protein
MYLWSQEDNEIAGKQAGIDGMEIGEMEKQEWWAQGQLERFVRGDCGCRAAFMRVKSGYRCMEWGHLVTDELIQQGRGGCYLMARGSTREDPVWEGPFYGKEVVEWRDGVGAPGPSLPDRGHMAGGRALRQFGRRYWNASDGEGVDRIYVSDGKIVGSMNFASYLYVVIVNLWW